MSKFVIFKNANPPYEGTPIILNTDAIVSIYEDLTHAEKKVMIWSKDNWPTPRVSDTEGGIASNVEMSNGSFSRTNAKGVRWEVKLKDAVANWPAWSTDEDVSTDQEPVQLTF